MNLPLLQVYSRPGCHLCEQFVEALLPLVRDRATVEVLNIDSRADWMEKYGQRIPVIEFQGHALCQYHLDEKALFAALDAAAFPQ